MDRSRRTPAAGRRPPRPRQSRLDRLGPPVFEPRRVHGPRSVPPGVLQGHLRPRGEGQQELGRGQRRCQDLRHQAASNVVTAHGQIVGANGEAGIAAKLVALQSIADSHADNLVKHINAMKARVADGRVLPEDVAKLAAGVQEATLMDAMAAGASSEVGRALNVLKMARQKRRAVNDMEAALDFMREAMGSGEDFDASKLGPILDRMSGVYRKKGTAGLQERDQEGPRDRPDRLRWLPDHGRPAVCAEVIRPQRPGFGVVRRAEHRRTLRRRRVRSHALHRHRQRRPRHLPRGSRLRGRSQRLAVRGLPGRATSLQGWRCCRRLSSVLPDGRMTNFVPFKMSPDRWSKWQKDPVGNLPGDDGVGHILRHAHPWLPPVHRHGRVHQGARSQRPAQRFGYPRGPLPGRP